MKPQGDSPSMHEIKTPCIRVTVDLGGVQHHQVMMKFKNMYTVSIVYSGFTYSTDINARRFDQEFRDTDPADSVEVAIFDPNGNFVSFQDGGQVKGFVPPDEVADIIHWVKNLNNPDKEKA